MSESISTQIFGEVFANLYGTDRPKAIEVNDGRHIPDLIDCEREAADTGTFLAALEDTSKPLPVVSGRDKAIASIVAKLALQLGACGKSPSTGDVLRIIHCAVLDGYSLGADDAHKRAMEAMA